MTPSVRRLSSLIGLVVVLALAMTGCIQSDDTENAVYSDPSTTADLGLPDNPRVVALGWSDGEIALSLGVKPVAIYDWMSFGAGAKGVGPWATDQFGSDSPEIISAASAGDFNYQQIKELNPDLILNVRAKSDAKVTDSLKAIAPVVTAPANAPDYAVNWKTQTQLIANALGKSSDGEAQIKQTTDLQSRLRSENPAFAGKTFVWGAKFGSAYGAYLPGDARFDTIAELGFIQFPPVAQLRAQGFFASVPVEKVSSLDSQVAVFAPIGMPLAQLQDDNLINSLPVTRDGRAVELAETDPIVQGMSAGTPESLRYALERITPMLAGAAAKVV
ncbi:ABC transporter substrate-binding protein [Gordonia hankookensis]|uniref:ABC transporter substrate-binding protein n=1 Tax=Gordonia hankookensis TaxID=589403 RepID=A0ABR7WAP7_9ACTN|nr:ABC transporter substrate-binding protein [Gordonia hankookensis]MBD1319886.1 ABC transporter substrate-binding protein [Gordonia hankookensis]